jgi:DNA-binding transcriptional MocR family regulator
MRLAIDRSGTRPLYQQVRDALRALIAEGKLEPGRELPASRALAGTLRVNRGTVTAAYDELVAQGLLERHVGRGTFVAQGLDLERLRERERPATAAADRLSWEGLFARDPLRDRDPILAELGKLSARPGVISFAGGYPDASFFPVDEFRRAVNGALRDEGGALLQYTASGCHAAFLEALKHLLLERGLAPAEDEILVTNGSQQGIDLVARLFLAPGESVVVEDPSYHGALASFRAAGARLVPVPVDDEGLEVAALARTLERERPRLIYVMPTCQNPTGVNLSIARRRRLLELAREHAVPIFEDDFKGDLQYDGDPLLPLRAEPDGQDVIYAGTFSKILFPGMRLAWLVAPPPVVARLAALKQSADLASSPLFQAAITRFARGRALERHLLTVRREYRRRRDTLLSALEREMPDGATWSRPKGGFSLLVRLPAPLDAAELLPHAAAKGVVYTPGRVFSLGGAAPALRLSFGSVKSVQIPEGVRRLAAVVREALKSARRARPSQALATTA